MLFSYKLLNEFIDLSDTTPEKLVTTLTFAGFEVESYHKQASGTKLVIGRIISCVKHPDSDHLHVLRVDVGQEGILDIVCGAPNAREGINVIVAEAGCILPAINEVIKPSKIRGVASNGMCCSLSELGVDKSVLSAKETDGIHELPEDAPIGSHQVLEYLGLDDTIIDINVLANRPDCLSVIGMAREIGALLNKNLVPLPKEDLKEGKCEYEVSSVTSSCDEFSLLEVEGAKDGVTPPIIVNYLNAIGIRSVSLIVDLGNFSMAVTGQPLHIYDLDKLEDAKLVAEDNYEGDFMALDGKTYHVIPGDVIISDGVKPRCLGGVMGGQNAAISITSSHLGIEAAHFYHAAIRHTSARLGLCSASSALFIKGVNPYIVKETLMYTAYLFKKYLPSIHIVGLASFNKVPPLQESFPFSVDKLNKRLGSQFSEDEVMSMLKRFHLVYKNGAILSDKHRLDLTEQCDIDEEMFRISAPERFIKTLDNLPQTIGGLTYRQQMLRKIRSNLVDCGLDQIISYTLVSQKNDRYLRVFNQGASYKVSNPLSEDHAYIRSDLLASMAATLNYNLARKHDDLALFEVSPIDTPEGSGLYLSFGLAGNIMERGIMKTHKADFFDLKGLSEDLLNICGLDERRYRFVRSANPNFHPGRSADLYIGKTLVGSLGELNPELGESDLVLGELDLGTILDQHISPLKVQPLSLLQPIRRDVAFVIHNDQVTAEDIIKEIKRAGGQYILETQIFDVFANQGITSMAFAITLVKNDKSFTDQEINSLINTIVLDVTHKLDVELKAL